MSKQEVASYTAETTVVDGSGRISVVTEPALPATCVVCRRSANGAIKFIDFNMDLDYYGAVVFCEDCMRECLHALQFVPLARLEIEKELSQKTLEELEVAQNELDRYRSFVDNLSTIRPDLGPVSLDDDSESADVDESNTPDPEPESNSDGPDPGGGLKNISIFADD